MSHPLVRLAQRFAVDWLDSADEAVPKTIMSPDYLVHIGDIALDGLADYTAATLGQLRQFPGLALTIHQLVTDGDWLALVFTEHGASAAHDLRAAAWCGVALFAWDGSVLTENWTQEDYHARRRQLGTGHPDAIRPPAVAPWTTPPSVPSPEAESTVRDWLQAPVLSNVLLDDGRSDALAVEVAAVEISQLFSAGSAVAFAADWTGRYRGGLDGAVDPGSDVTLGCAGVLTVADGAVIAGSVVTDRSGLRRRLLPPRG